MQIAPTSSRFEGAGRSWQQNVSDSKAFPIAEHFWQQRISSNRFLERLQERDIYRNGRFEQQCYLRKGRFRAILCS
ncbi:hypothetical protein IG631_23932 [Alternaria alternata]|nr:hypothetical protein IG631_23932 [Alternaria alternata]